MDSIALTIIENEPRIDSRVAAKRLGIRHANFIETLHTYEKELAELGQLRFETEVGYRTQGGGNPAIYVMLNENQAVFAVTLSRNTPKVVEFKLGLVKAFWRMREIMQAIQYAPDADFTSLTPRQVRLVGMAGQLADLQETNPALIPSHIGRMIAEIEAWTGEDRIWPEREQTPVKQIDKPGNTDS